MVYDCKLQVYGFKFMIYSSKTCTFAGRFDLWVMISNLWFRLRVGQPSAVGECVLVSECLLLRVGTAC